MEELILKNLPNWGWAMIAVYLIISELIVLIKENNPMFQALTKYQDVFTILERIQADTGADRVVLLKAHNSGKELTPKTKLKSSALFSTANKQLLDVAKTWTEQPVDLPYVKMLMDLAVKKLIRLQSENLDDGILKTLYEGNNIKVSYVAEVMQVTKRKTLFQSLLRRKEPYEYLYISANFQKQVLDLDNIADRVRSGASEIRRIIK